MFVRMYIFRPHRFNLQIRHSTAASRGQLPMACRRGKPHRLNPGTGMMCIATLLQLVCNPGCHRNWNSERVRPHSRWSKVKESSSLESSFNDFTQPT